MMKIEGSWWGRRSVKLDETSQLFNFITSIKNKIFIEMGITNDRPPHVEICSDEDYKNGCNRDSSLKEVLDIVVDTSDIKNYSIIGRAYCLCIGNVGNKPRHITIVFGVRTNDLEKLNKITLNLIK